MNLKLEGKSYELKFGFGCYRRVCQAYGKNKVSDFDQLIKDHDLDNIEDPTFEQLEFISCLIVSAIQNADKSVDINFDSDDLFDHLMKDESALEDIFKEFNDSQVPEKPEEEKK